MHTGIRWWLTVGFVTDPYRATMEEGWRGDVEIPLTISQTYNLRIQIAFANTPQPLRYQPVKASRT